MIGYEIYRRRASVVAAAVGLLLILSGCSARDAVLDGVHAGVSDTIAGIVGGILGGFLGM